MPEKSKNDYRASHFACARCLYIGFEESLLTLRMDYFKKLLDLLKTERDEDRLSYLKLTEQSSVSERRANGLTWYQSPSEGLK